MELMLTKSNRGFSSAAFIFTDGQRGYKLKKERLSKITEEEERQFNNSDLSNIFRKIKKGQKCYRYKCYINIV